MVTRKMVPYLPDSDLPVAPRRERSLASDGSQKETEEYQLVELQGLEALRRLWAMFRTNLMMAVASNPHIEALRFSREQIDDLYRFLDGPRIARRNPTPS